jgi:hypothetical protein
MAMNEQPDETELDALMQRIRAEIAAQQRACAEGLLSRDALPQRWADFAALPEDAFVEAAYLVALKRSPNADEATHSSWTLRGGTSRAKYLTGLLALPEASAHGARIPGLARQVAVDRLRRMFQDSGVQQRLRPALRIARGLRRLAHSAPRLARLDETLAAVQRASVAEQTQRFATFALQQSSALRALEARVNTLETRRVGPSLEQVLATLSGAAPPQPGVVHVPDDATLAMLDALLAAAAPGASFSLPRLAPTAGGWIAASPVASASPELLRRLAVAHGLAFEEPMDGPPLIRPA